MPKETCIVRDEPLKDLLSDIFGTGPNSVAGQYKSSSLSWKDDSHHPEQKEKSRDTIHDLRSAIG